ncbi:NAD(P)/FAD-dependent oxidoreductase [Halioglobus maricola]|uniref:NAD(P)/FAD-dependent oxidoreductase n=1 Tax=Halioglobus maricola TaxID=2601894 RepID=A0A5P9NHJ4_9GAMM|nr:NAD(P)/FAD-dependent oxidoreductase [Halioglobus maricola]QFU75293.1 NAD(P)/FAD-dependent oxidoreductase [Halioglobus maricola]
MSQADSPLQILDVLIVGAGFGGICAGIKLRQAGIENFKIFDKAAGIGGTWWHNTYPGAACDIQSHLYCYSFEPNPNWSRKFSPQKEIQAYIERCAEKYAIMGNIHLEREIQQHAFVDGLWRTTFTDGEIEWSRHVIFATGGLHVPSFPDIAGRDTFNGPTMHSAEWNHSVDFADKKVAVIGSAASAIQLVPELAKISAKVNVYQRTPNYIAPRNDIEYPEWVKKLFSALPLTNWLYRKIIFLRGDYLLFPVVKTKRESRWRNLLEGKIKTHIRTSVNDQELSERMVPDYPMGCKRILIADNFYNAINRDNVTLITDGIDRIEADGIVTANGEKQAVDIIVYATGFDMEKHLVAVEVIDTAGKSLAERWQSGRPSAYKGGFVPGLPNFYMTTGPNTGFGTTSVVGVIEAQLQLILEAIELTGQDQLIEPSESACQKYVDDIRSALDETVWGGGSCSSWYVNEQGENDTLYPYSASTFMKDHRRLAIGDFRVYPRS